MKKLALSAIAVMAIVTSALAFNATPADTLLCDDPDIEGFACTELTIAVTFDITKTGIPANEICARPGLSECSTDPVYISN